MATVNNKDKPAVKKNSTTLDDLLAAAENLYGSYDLPDYSVKLRPLLRLSKAERKELTAATDADLVDEDGEKIDYLDTLKIWVRIVADNKVGADKLIEDLGDRLDVFKVLQDRWSDTSQPGEAQPSES